MKKNSILPGLLGIVALCFTLSAFLFPLGPGAITAEGDVIYGYDLMFGNKAVAAFETPVGPFIAVFVLFVISAVFQILGTVFGWRGGKFTGFLHILSGLMMVVSAVLCFLVGVVTPAGNLVTLSLDWGFLGTGISAAVSGLLSLFIGVRSFFAKTN